MSFVTILFSTKISLIFQLETIKKQFVEILKLADKKTNIIVFDEGSGERKTIVGELDVKKNTTVRMETLIFECVNKICGYKWCCFCW